MKYSDNINSLQKSPKAAWRRVEEEVVIIASDSNALAVLNWSGAWLWEHFDTMSTFDDWVKNFAEEFDIDHAQAKHDVDVFVADLLQKGLLRKRPIA